VKEGRVTDRAAQPGIPVLNGISHPPFFIGSLEIDKGTCGLEHVGEIDQQNQNAEPDYGPEEEAWSNGRSSWNGLRSHRHLSFLFFM
jgi:hypothetical protein